MWEPQPPCEGVATLAPILPCVQVQLPGSLYKQVHLCEDPLVRKSRLPCVGVATPCKGVATLTPLLPCLQVQLAGSLQKQVHLYEESIPNNTISWGLLRDKKGLLAYSPRGFWDI